jgi:broad specificity phosphatase PhoE
MNQARSLLLIALHLPPPSAHRRLVLVNEVMNQYSSHASVPPPNRTAPSTSSVPIDAWFSSTLKRSDETLTLIHQRQRNGSKQKFWGRTQLSSLNEIDYGRLEGRRLDDSGLPAALCAMPYGALLGGESESDLEARVDEALGLVLAPPPSQTTTISSSSSSSISSSRRSSRTVLVASHGAFLAHLLARLLQPPPLLGTGARAGAGGMLRLWGDQPLELLDEPDAQTSAAAAAGAADMYFGGGGGSGSGAAAVDSTTTTTSSASGGGAIVGASLPASLVAATICMPRLSNCGVSVVDVRHGDGQATLRALDYTEHLRVR